MKNKGKFAFLSFITLIALIVRLAGRNVIVDDMTSFLLPWFETIKNGGGLTALNEQVGDYGLLYQTIIALFTYVDANPVYLYKSFSVIFDFLLALSIAYFVSNSGKGTFIKGNPFCLSYAYVIMLPTVVMNSAFWGQSDSIYTCFLLWSIWFLYKEKYGFSFFMLGCALSFKLQSILLFPLFFYAFLKKNYSLLYFLITIFTFWFSGVVAYFYGRNFLDGIRIYLYQAGEYHHMWMNVPSFWVLVSDDYHKLHLLAIGLTFLILGAFFIKSKERLRMDTFEKIFGLAAFIEWTCILFLPAMHERYTYVLDLLLIMLAFINKRCIRYAFITSTMSCLTYNAYLFSGKEPINSSLVIIYLLTWLHFSYTSFRSSFIED